MAKSKLQQWTEDKIREQGGDPRTPKEKNRDNIITIMKWIKEGKENDPFFMWKFWSRIALNVSVVAIIIYALILMWS